MHHTILRMSPWSQDETIKKNVGKLSLTRKETVLVVAITLLRLCKKTPASNQESDPVAVFASRQTRFGQIWASRPLMNRMHFKAQEPG